MIFDFFLVYIKEAFIHREKRGIMEENYKMINGVIFAEEKKNNIVLLGKDGLYRLHLEVFGWSGEYVLPGEKEKVRKKFKSKHEALQDVYRTDIQRRKRPWLEVEEIIRILFQDE